MERPERVRRGLLVQPVRIGAAKEEVCRWALLVSELARD
jgi:hypothetical protein